MVGFSLGIPREIKQSRSNFSKKIVEKQFSKQTRRCNHCRTKFSPTVQIVKDHKNGDNSDNSEKNCQLLCANCHDNKSRKENSERAKGEKEKSRNNHLFDGSEPTEFKGLGF